MKLLKYNDKYVGVGGLCTELDKVFAVKFTNNNIYIPTLDRYLCYTDNVVYYGEQPSFWGLTTQNVLITKNYQVLTFSNNWNLMQSTIENLESLNGVKLHEPITDAEILVANGMVLIPTFTLDSNLVKELEQSEHLRIGDLMKKNWRYAQCLSNRRLQNLLGDLFGDFHLTTFSSNKLVKNVDQRHWHVDYPYHNISSPYLDKLDRLWLAVQVIVPLVDFTEQNGSTLYVPNSHHKLCWPEPNHDHKNLTIPKNFMAVFIGSLWHSQGVNITDASRPALLANFSNDNVPAKDDIASQVTIENPIFNVIDNRVKYY